MLICASALLAVLPACGGGDDDNGESGPDRLFRPVSFSCSVSGATTVTVSWAPINGATYLLELSRDSMRFETDLRSVEPGQVTFYRFDDLWHNTLYSARIKAVSSNPAIADSEYQTLVFTPKFDFFQTITEGSITANSVTVKWEAGKKLDRIAAYASGAGNTDFTVSEAEQSAGQKTLSGLTSAKNYTLTGFFGEIPRGTIQFTTK
jgi:hypothetical protein